ncbi:hypothetical protein ACHAXT_012342 [Thalassiosira profunda]
MPRPIARTNMDDTGHRVEALGSWDHGMEQFDDQNNEPKIESVQEFVKRTLTLTCSALRKGMKRIQESEFFSDPRLREGYNSHTEEDVAGERMAVRDVVHQRSFM